MDDTQKDTRKDTNLQIRINGDLKTAFENKCKDNYTNKAAVLTEFIVNYVRDVK